MTKQPDTIVRGALKDPSGTYRYTLERRWASPQVANDDLTLFCVGLNPSTADERTDDRTANKLLGYASREGYHAYVLCNLFAYRATNPQALLRCNDPVGPDNDRVICELLGRYRDNTGRPAHVLLMWGRPAHSRLLAMVRARAKALAVVLRQHSTFALGLTKCDQFPRHPLYLSNASRLFSWPVR